jgi:hypothetical protein
MFSGGGAREPLYQVAVIEVIMRSCWKNIQIVAMAEPGEDKSPLPPFKKGGFKNQQA